MANKFATNRCVALLLALIMVLSLAACGAKDSSQTDTAPTDDASLSIEPSQDPVTPGEELASPSDQADDEAGVEEPIAPTQPSSEPLSEEPTSTDAPSAEAEPSINGTPAPTSTPVPTATPMPTVSPTNQDDSAPNLTPTQRNSINMLNYMSALTQRVNEERRNQLFLETAYKSFDNLYPNAVDTKTQAQITSLMDTIEGYRMISVKRDRLMYIYEQNRAQAMRQAIPNPLGLLSAVQSGSLLKAAVSVLYMAVDAKTSYDSATSHADMQFIQEGWELDDAESSALHESTKAALTYLLDMVRTYDLPGD